jgi:hypothetical protein
LPGVRNWANGIESGPVYFTQGDYIPFAFQETDWTATSYRIQMSLSAFFGPDGHVWTYNAPADFNPLGDDPSDPSHTINRTNYITFTAAGHYTLGTQAWNTYGTNYASSIEVFVAAAPTPTPGPAPTATPTDTPVPPTPTPTDTPAPTPTPTWDPDCQYMNFQALWYVGLSIYALDVTFTGCDGTPMHVTYSGATPYTTGYYCVRNGTWSFVYGTFAGSLGSICAGH